MENLNTAVNAAKKEKEEQEKKALEQDKTHVAELLKIQNSIIFPDEQSQIKLQVRRSHKWNYI